MKEKLIKLLAEHIGVEPEDVNEDDSFLEDLHMDPADFSDFIHVLEKSGFTVNSSDLTGIETVEDLIEVLDVH